MSCNHPHENTWSCFTIREYNHSLAFSPPCDLLYIPCLISNVKEATKLLFFGAFEILLAHICFPLGWNKLIKFSIRLEVSYIYSVFPPIHMSPIGSVSLENSNRSFTSLEMFQLLSVQRKFFDEFSQTFPSEAPFMHS